MIQWPADELGGIGPGRQVPQGAGRGAAPKAQGAGSSPAGLQGAGDSVRLLAIALNRSIGSGKTIVELLSPAMLASVCK